VVAAIPTPPRRGLNQPFTDVTMMATHNLILLIAATALAIFTVANVSGFGRASADADERQRAKMALKNGNAHLIDVRTPREYANNGLDSARNIPLQELENRLAEIGNTEDPVVLYCQSGNRSGQAADILQRNGFRDVYDLGALRTARTVVEEAL
jgi:phage shock protein E